MNTVFSTAASLDSTKGGTGGGNTGGGGNAGGGNAGGSVIGEIPRPNLFDGEIDSPENGNFYCLHNSSFSLRIEC